MQQSTSEPTPNLAGVAEPARTLPFEAVLGAGWARPGQGACWTDGDTAQLVFALEPDGPSEYVLSVRCHAFLGRGEIEHQVVSVAVDGVVVATWAVRRDHGYTAVIPALLARDGRLSIDLHVSRPCAPADLGISDDRRRLGVAVTSVALVPMQPDYTALNWLGSDGDPIGRVFSRDGFVYRAIRRQSVPFVRQLQELGVYRDLADRGLIPQGEFIDIEHDEYGMVVRTVAASWSVVPAQYCLLALRDAALVWIAINEYLLASPLPQIHQLIDGHGGNFALFKASRPQWVDLGSIAPAKGLFGMKQFVRCFVHPLLIAFRHPDKIAAARRLMATQGDGISAADLQALGAADLAGLLEDVDRSAFERSAIAALLARLRACVEEMHFERVSNFWSNYRVPEELEAAWQGHYAINHRDSRFRTVVGEVRKLGLSTFMDVGSNDGIFSLMCAREGKVGLAVDTDDASLNKLYQFLGHHPEIQMTVAHGAFADVPNRAELVLCLALTHHLFLSQGLGFEAIARKLAAMCSRAVITEYMPNGLGGTSAIPDDYPNPLPDGYTLEAFLGAFRQVFQQVSVVEYQREHAPSRRVLVVCENPLT